MFNTSFSCSFNGALSDKSSKKLSTLTLNPGTVTSDGNGGFTITSNSGSTKTNNDNQGSLISANKNSNDFQENINSLDNSTAKLIKEAIAKAQEQYGNSNNLLKDFQNLSITKLVEILQNIKKQFN